MRRNIFRSVTLGTALLASLATAGCNGGVRETLGLNKNAPDEFQVVSRQPLSVPPEFTLRPPEPGAERPQRRDTREQAKQTVFRQNETANAGEGYQGNGAMSNGEQALLTRAGAQDAPADIRDLVAREARQYGDDNPGLVERLVFWRDHGEPAKVVDADRESKRLRENMALGKDITEGETPTIERGERGFLEGIF